MPDIEQRIQDLATRKLDAAFLAYSGGLDSTLCIELLRRCYCVDRLELVLYDIGQGNRRVRQALDFARQLDAPEPTVVDLRAKFGDWIARAIQANATFRGYPIAAPIAKQLMSRELATLARTRGIQVVAEGSSGRGNDQFRMAGPMALFAPDVEVLAPIRELDLSRTDEEELCAAWGVPIDKDLPPGGDDVTPWCRSIASGMIGLDTIVPDDVWLWYRPQGTTLPAPVELEVTFEEGVPVALDGELIPLFDLLARLNVLVGSYGIGKIDIIEDGILGLKSRELYEAPAATLLLMLHSDLEHLCLTQEEIAFKQQVEAQWLWLVYTGNAFHPLVEALNSFIETTQCRVSGSVGVRLLAGQAEVTRRESSHSLYLPKLRHLDAATAFDQRQMAGAVVAHTLPYLAIAERNSGQQ